MLQSMQHRMHEQSVCRAPTCRVECSANALSCSMSLACSTGPSLIMSVTCTCAQIEQCSSRGLVADQAVKQHYCRRSSPQQGPAAHRELSALQSAGVVADTAHIVALHLQHVDIPSPWPHFTVWHAAYVMLYIAAA